MSISTMNDDLNILQNLAIPAFEEDVDVIQKLDDEPNDVGGLTAAELKAKFDEAGNRIKTYLNETLVPSISETVAEAEKRAEAEAARVLAEEQRVTAEQARVSSEAEREQAEAERRAGEAERAAAEAERKTAEDARVLAEQKREDTDSGIVAQATSAAEAAENAANKAASAAIHQPIVGDNGNWHTWSFDAGAYVDTGIYAGGDAPYIGENGNWYVGQTDTGVAATSSGVYVGSGNMPGGYNLQIDPEGEETDIIPYIGPNGHWFLGDTDLNVSATGPTGPVGEKGDMGPAGPAGSDGQDGVDGKSAYQYAVEGGYTGTEESFAAKLAAEIPTVDSTLTKSGHAADAAAVGEQLSNLSEEIANLQTSGLTTEQVNALDGMFKVCAFTKADVSAEYTAFKTAFGITDSGGETELTLTSISATYDGGDVSVGTALSDLTGIVVTAHYSDGSSATVTGYTLDGTIAEGENTVTVIYGGKMTEFVVVGVAESGGEVVMLKSITGDGASWIDTEVLPETTHRYEISATLTGVTPEYFVGCDMSNVGSSYGGFYVNTHSSVAFSGCLNKNKFTGAGTWNTTEANLLTNKQAYFVIKDGLQAVYLDADYTIQQSGVANGTTVWGANDGAEVPIIPIYLFRLNYTSQTHQSITANYTPTATKIFWFKIYENSTDELLHEFLPAKHGSKIGMYDTVTGKFHENIGTGTFSYEEVAT